MNPNTTEEVFFSLLCCWYKLNFIFQAILLVLDDNANDFGDDADDDKNK